MSKHDKRIKRGKEKRYEYGHAPEYGSDGKRTGRVVSTKVDRDTGKIIDKVIHTKYDPNDV